MKTINTIALGILLLTCSVISNAQNNSPLSADKQRKFDFFFIDALHYKAIGDYEHALKMYTECLKIEPESAVCQYEIANLFSGQPDKAQSALQLYASAARLNPSNHWYQERLGQFYIQNKLPNQAIDVYKKLFNDNPSNMNYAFVLTEMLKQTNRIPEAIDVIDKIQNTVGVTPELIMEKQRLQMSIKDYDGAIRDINLLIDKHPSDYRYQIIKGDIYMSNKKSKQALECYNNALKSEPDNGNIHLALAGYYENAQNAKKTEDELLKAFASKDVDVNRKMGILGQYLQAEEEAKQDTTAKKVDFPYNTNKNDRRFIRSPPQRPHITTLYGYSITQRWRQPSGYDSF